MSQKAQAKDKSKNNSKDMKLNIFSIKKSKPVTIYSSRQQNQSSSIESRKSSAKAQKNRSISSLNRTINQLSVDQALIKSLKLVTMRKLNPEVSLLKKQCQKMLQQNTRENRLKLSEILLQSHPFFSKIHPSIAEAIVLLSKTMMYYKGQLIFDTIQEQKKYEMQNINGRSKQDLGFVIYGKIQLANDRQFYSHYLNNQGTLFQEKFLNRQDKNPYFANVCEPSFILWLSKSSYYVIRKQCFLTLDLKYKFGEFQNILKFNMVQKKLGDCNKI